MCSKAAKYSCLLGALEPLLAFVGDSLSLRLNGCNLGLLLSSSASSDCFDSTSVLTSVLWCVRQFSSVLQNVQALREQTLMLVHGTADGKAIQINCYMLKKSRNIRFWRPVREGRQPRDKKKTKGDECMFFSSEGLENMWRVCTQTDSDCLFLFLP